MKLIHNLTLLFTVTVFTLSSAYGEALKVTADKENVVASKLEGAWALNAKMTQALTGKDQAKGENALNKITFTKDDTIVAKIPQKYEKHLKGKTIYMAGTFSAMDRTFPFILIEMSGNPHIVFFQERRGDPYGDAESFNVMLAVAKDTNNDMLFIGGDFNNQPFSSFKRVAKK